METPGDLKSAVCGFKSHHRYKYLENRQIGVRCAGLLNQFGVKSGVRSALTFSAQKEDIAATMEWRSVLKTEARLMKQERGSVPLSSAITIGK